jgi:hypothetical protein
MAGSLGIKILKYPLGTIDWQDKLQGVVSKHHRVIQGLTGEFPLPLSQDFQQIGK